MVSPRSRPSKGKRAGRQRGKAMVEQHREAAREFFYSLQRKLEAHRGGEELLPAAGHLSLVTGLPLSDTAKRNTAGQRIGEPAALGVLQEIEEELRYGSHALAREEAGRLRAKLEEHVRGLAVMRGRPVVLKERSRKKGRASAVVFKPR